MNEKTFNLKTSSTLFLNLKTVITANQKILLNLIAIIFIATFQIEALDVALRTILLLIAFISLILALQNQSRTSSDILILVSMFVLIIVSIFGLFSFDIPYLYPIGTILVITLLITDATNIIIKGTSQRLKGIVISSTMIILVAFYTTFALTEFSPVTSTLALKAQSVFDLIGGEGNIWWGILAVGCLALFIYAIYYGYKSNLAKGGNTPSSSVKIVKSKTKEENDGEQYYEA